MGTVVPDSLHMEQQQAEICEHQNNTKLNIDMTSIRMFSNHHVSNVLAVLTVKLLMICSTLFLILLLLFWHYGGFVLLILLHVAILGVLYNAQDILLYYPDQPTSSRLFIDSPAAFGLAYENVYFRSQDQTLLHAQFVHQSTFNFSSLPTVIFFHGNAGNIGHRLPNVQAMCTLNCVNVLLVEYRGYGKSRGHPSEQGLYQDACAAVDYVYSRSDVNQQKIVVFGRSLGGAVALRVASDPYYASRIAAVIVENTFTSIPEMSRVLFNISLLSYLPDWCYKNKYLSRCLVHKIAIPALFICGLQDNLVPPRMMHQLYELCGSQMKRLALFPDGTHNDTWRCNGYYSSLNRFLTEVENLRKGVFVATSATYGDAGDVPYADRGDSTPPFI